jgi:hypothetical protein
MHPTSFANNFVDAIKSQVGRLRYCRYKDCQRKQANSSLLIQTSILPTSTIKSDRQNRYIAQKKSRCLLMYCQANELILFCYIPRIPLFSVINFPIILICLKMRPFSAKQDDRQTRRWQLQENKIRLTCGAK